MSLGSRAVNIATLGLPENNDAGVGHTAAVTCLAPLPFGFTVTGGQDARIYVWSNFTAPAGALTAVGGAPAVAVTMMRSMSAVGMTAVLALAALPSDADWDGGSDEDRDTVTARATRSHWRVRTLGM